MPSRVRQGRIRRQSRNVVPTFDNDNVNSHDLGRMNCVCHHCGAFRWKSENKALCCAHGQVTLPPYPPPPPLLQQLFTGSDSRSKKFRENIRAYNNSLAFASLGVNEEVMPPGVYCFKVNGEVHHCLGPLLPQNERPKFAQIYIYDTMNETSNRMQWNDSLDADIVRDLQGLLHEINPFVQLYRHASDVISTAGDQAGQVKMLLKADSNKDYRRYNLPQASEVAVILPDQPFECTHRDIVLYRHRTDDPDGLPIKRISEKHPQYDPLHYVLFFPYGHEGWRLGISFNGNRTGKVSPMNFYAYRIMVREEDNIILQGGRLFQQYVVDQYSKMEMQRLKFLQNNQSTLRAELYQGLSDAVTAGDVEGATVGRKIVLPATFTGSPRSMIQLYQDAMGIVRKYGKPDLFITFTCNPSWTEIKRELYDHQTPSDRPDLVSRVFKMKVNEFMYDLTKKNIFGKVIAYVKVVEFQKRGLPHVHILLILDHDSKPKSVDQVDRIVKAELPEEPQLRQLVEMHMIHGPCGLGFPNSPCMKDKGCSKRFPRSFVPQTALTESSYPDYQRRDNGQTVEKGGAILDNRWVVPYNPFLLQKYRGHINVEVCNSVTAVKYLYKYVYKGHDRVMVEFRDGQDDEIKKYVDARYVSASEACWRLFHFELQDRYPSIQRLAVHLPGQQSIVYHNGQAQEAIQNMKNTTLTAWFQANGAYPQARVVSYHEMPEFFTWDSKNKKWKPRQRQLSIGRLYNACPSEGERFFLRLLLQYVKGARCFEDLRRLDSGQLCQTFREAALHRGLLQDDEEWKCCLQEAALAHNAAQLRKLFSVILIFCEPSNPVDLWTQFKTQMCEDFMYQGQQQRLSPTHMNSALIHLKDLLLTHRRHLSDFGLPEPTVTDCQPSTTVWDPAQESAKAEARFQQLNADQNVAFTTIKNEVLSGGANGKRLFFIDGPGGCGKTFLYNALLSFVRGRQLHAIAVASSGIAAELLEGGRTAHSAFKIPIPIQDNSTCNISKQSQLAQQVKSASLIVWDEAPMMDRRVFECVSRTFCDLLDDCRPFGGKVVVLGGDFRQILPVVPRGGEADIVNATLHKSVLWQEVQILRLKQNMRAVNDCGDFQEWLTRIGDGDEEIYPALSESAIKIPPELCVSANDKHSLVTAVFPHLQEIFRDDHYLGERAILCTTNDSADMINTAVTNLIDAPQRDYFSADSADDTNNSGLFPIEFLNSLNLPGLPPHKLTLKEHTPVMLLRNLDPKSGLLNGTRLKVIRLGDRVIEASILTGSRKGTRVFLPRITMTPSETTLPFQLKRRQFPLKPCYAMTINKSQGQTLPSVGIFLPVSVFTHGQLYVALSRAKDFSGITLSLQDRDNEEPFYTDNIVYRCVLQTT